MKRIAVVLLFVLAGCAGIQRKPETVEELRLSVEQVSRLSYMTGYLVGGAILATNPDREIELEQMAIYFNQAGMRIIEQSLEQSERTEIERRVNELLRGSEEAWQMNVLYLILSWVSEAVLYESDQTQGAVGLIRLGDGIHNAVVDRNAWADLRIEEVR